MSDKLRNSLFVLPFIAIVKTFFNYTLTYSPIVNYLKNLKLYSKIINFWKFGPGMAFFIAVPKRS